MNGVQYFIMKPSYKFSLLQTKVNTVQGATQNNMIRHFLNTPNLKKQWEFKANCYLPENYEFPTGILYC